MSWRFLPPAGNPICFDRSKAPPEFPGYRSIWVQSGTAALALGLIVARSRHPGVDNPEVILPGYACPDLVAAAEYAGLTPVLADIGDDDPGYDLSKLTEVISARTVALVAVNFLGISEQLSDLRALLEAWPSVALIEDNAQWFPEPTGGSALSGDLACLSFGRGKPVSLLGGGVLLAREGFDVGRVADYVQLAVDSDSSDGKSRVYNMLLSPWIYGLVARAPFLKLGTTVFKPLHAVRAMETARLSLLGANAEVYLRRSENIAHQLTGMLPSTVMDLPSLLADRRGRLLRYPILCPDGESRDRWLSRLHRAGLGATAMYQRHLSGIDGIAEKVKFSGSLTGAQRFSRRLITLPVHSGVTVDDVQRMCRAFS